mgnify:CR=1 FL=1
MNICVSGKLLFIQDKLKRVVCNLMWEFQWIKENNPEFSV